MQATGFATILAVLVEAPTGSAMLAEQDIVDTVVAEPMAASVSPFSCSQTPNAQELSTSPRGGTVVWKLGRRD